MQSSVEVLREGRARIAKAWTQDSLLDNVNMGGDASGVISVCALGSLMPAPIIELMAAHEVDYSDLWLSPTRFDQDELVQSLVGYGLLAPDQEWEYGCGYECKATEFLADAIREIDPKEAKQSERATRSHWRENRARCLGMIAQGNEDVVADHERVNYLTPSGKPDRAYIDHPLITSYNDRDERTQDEMLVVFDRAIELALAAEAAKVAERMVREVDLATAGD